MKALPPIAIALLLALGTASAFAQENTNPRDTSGGVGAPQTSNTGTSPEGMGSAGWTGPHRGETTGSAPTAYVPTPSTDKQPPVATGLDLRGPPMAFPSNKAPE